MTRRSTRLVWIGVIGCVLAAAVGLSMFALRSGIAYAMDPSDLKEKSIGPGQRVRLVGLVKEGTVVRGDGLKVVFEITDSVETISVEFNNILPDLFREKQGIITEGVLRDDGVFAADTVLAKHDENYMPKEVADSLKKRGVWQGDGTAEQ